MTVCLKGNFISGDNITVTMGDFNSSNKEAFGFNTTQKVFNSWNYVLNVIHFSVRSPFGGCFVGIVDEKRGLVLPSTAIYKNSRAFKITIESTYHPIVGAIFDFVTPVGAGSSSVALGSPQPGAVSTVILNFTVISRITVNSTIGFVLPGFVLEGIDNQPNEPRYPLDLAGPAAYALKGYWNQSNGEVLLVPIYDLLVGDYSVTVSDSTPLRIPQTGVSTISPPFFRISSSTLAVASTEVLIYPRVVGLVGISLRVGLIEGGTGGISSLTLTVHLSRAIGGPTSVLLTVPFIDSICGSFQGTYSTGDSFAWNSYDRTFNVSTTSRWVGNSTLTLHLVNGFEMTYFVRNDDYSPSLYSQSTLCIKTTDGPYVQTTHSPYIQSLLPSTVITDINRIPQIQYSSIRYSPDIFTLNATITIKLILNIAAVEGDIFTFFLYGSKGTSGMNLTATGPCISGNIEGVSWNNANSLLTLPVYTSNNTGCLAGGEELTWLISPLAGISSPQAVVQVTTPLFKAYWITKNITYSAFVTDPPTIGFLSAEVAFPHLGGVSPALTLTLLSGTLLLPLDTILITLTGFHLTALSSQLSIRESAYGLNWQSSFNHSTQQLALIVPAALDGSTLIFEIDKIFKITLPSYAVVNKIRIKRNEGFYGVNPVYGGVEDQGNYSISLTRGGQKLNGGVIQIQAVGKILSASITVIPYAVSRVTNKRTVQFQVLFILSSQLNLGDEMIFITNDFIYNMNSSLVVTGNRSYTGYTINDKLIISTTKELNSTTVSFTIEANDAVTLSENPCGSTGCSFKVSIASTTCPIVDHLVYVSLVGLFANTAIRIRILDAVPTYYPTGQPSRQPSSQPSRQPTIQPTGHLSSSL